MRWRRSSAYLAAALLALLAPGRAEAAGRWEYTIGPGDTPATVDAQRTDAVVDTGLYEIRLPRVAGQTAAFWPDGGQDYLVLTRDRVIHFSFDGSGMVENAVLSVPLEQAANPVALAAPLPYPDVVVAASDGIRHYSFDGGGMVRNPALEVAGLTPVASIGVRGATQVAALVQGAVKHYSFSGTGMAENPWLEPAAAFNNPVALALRPDAFDLTVADTDPATGQGRVRFFGFDGAGLSEIPALAITGLPGVKAVAYGDGGSVAVVAGSEVRHYAFDGAGMAYVSALSVQGLAAPAAVALRPGTWDRLIVDGDRVRYFAWDGAQLVEDPARSVTVAGLSALGQYAPAARAVSLAFDPATPADRVRVRAAHALEPNTQVVWSVTADGASWVPRWRVRADAAGTAVCEATPDGGATWVPIGDPAACGPGAGREEQWAAVAPGRAVRWRAELSTTDGARTPRVKAAIPGAVAVVLEADARPSPPAPDPGPSGCYNTTTPTFTWSFADPDPGDTQAAFQVEVRRAGDGALVHDSGRVVSGTTSYTLPTSADPAADGPLWSSGTYRFTWRVRVWDPWGQASDWSGPQPFCVLALERLRVIEIVSPPPGQPAPDPNDPATHILVRPGQDPATLPRAKAGARVRFRVDGVGPVTGFTAVFRYTDASGTVREATVGPGTPAWLRPPGSETNRWEVDVWTEASLAVVPSGTVVWAELTGDAGALGAARWVPTPPYESGACRTQGSIYEDWTVVLHGG